jgi:hypothetical protein
MNKRTIIIIGIIIGLYLVYNYAIPFNKNDGTEFNHQREKLGIPILGNNWTIDKSESEQFATCWWKPESRNGHFKKIIEYGIFKPKSETDYYQNENLKGTFAWSKYDYGKNTFEYFLEKPNDKTVSVNEKGNLKIEKQTEILNINKAEFEKYIKE